MEKEKKMEMKDNTNKRSENSVTVIEATVIIGNIFCEEETLLEVK